MYQLLLFDFDGTLFDTGPGVMNCVRYALEKLGVTEDDPAHLRKFVGPPLDEMFGELYGFPPEKARRAVELYRERYQPVGIWECEPYPGLAELLDKLRCAGYQLAVATSKPVPSATRILERYDMVRRFDFVCGSEFDGTRSKKHEVVQAVLEHFGLTETPERALMIGDRKYDILGAGKCGVPCLGVSYGYAEPGELEAYGAIAVAKDAAELERILIP